MKIIQINTVYEEKSTGRTCFEVEKALNKSGHTCVTAYGVGNHPKSDKAYKIDNKVEYLFHNIMSRITGLEGYFSFFATKRLVKFLEEEKPDIIHLRNLHGHYLNLPVLFRYLEKKQYPIIQHLHDCWIYTGKCTYYTSQGCYKWKEECNNCPKKKAYPKSYWFDFSHKMRKDKERWYSKLNNLHVIGVSDWVTNEAKDSFFGHAKSISRIYNWINQDIFQSYGSFENKATRRKYGIPQDKYMIIGVSASWVEGSPRYDDFMKIAKTLSNNEVLVLVGRSEKPITNTNIIHIPFVNDTKELAKIYSCADVYIHCSVEDTFGKVIAEALACGVPTIVYGITGCAEIPGEDCGIIVEPRNIDQVRSAIEKMKQKDKKQITNACITRVNELFNYEKNVSELINVYTRLCGYDE